MPVVPWVKKQRLFDARVLAAHCVHVDEGEMRALKDAGAGVAHNPTSNLKLGSGIAPVAKMLELGVTVGIGTDGAASNNDLDMFEEMRLAALLAKGISGDPTALPARAGAGHGDAHRRARDSSWRPHRLARARQARRSHRRRPRSDRTTSPRFDRDPNAVYSQLVYAAKSTDVVDVMCDGRWLMRDRRLLTLDEDDAPRGRARRGAAHRRVPDRARAERAAEARSRSAAPRNRKASRSRSRRASRSPDTVLAALASDDITVIRAVHYHQYDTYFFFDDPEPGPPALSGRRVSRRAGQRGRTPARG